LLLLLFWTLGTLTPDVKPPKKVEEKKIKISLKELPKKEKKSDEVKKKVQPSPIAPPMPKGEQLKKIVKKPPIKFIPKKKPTKPKLNKPTKPKKIEPKPKVEPLPPQKPYIPLLDPKKVKPKEIKKEPKKVKDPMAWMYEDQSKVEEEKPKAKRSQFGTAATTKEMKELYGSKWGELTAGQQKYMLDNQEIMRRITQQVLTRVARVNLKRNLNVNRTNVIEFYLHPNGDMSDFKFVKQSGYYILDDTTKETIEYAYSEYPRPDEKILVRYNVYYNLARY